MIVARNPQAPDAEPLVLPCTLAQAVEAAEGALAELCADVETTGFPPGHPDHALRLVQLGDEWTASVFDPDDEDHRAAIRDLITRAEKLHAHSAAADLVPLALAGIVPADVTWPKMTDSVLIAKLIDPAQATSDADGLKKLAEDLLGPYAVSPAADKARAALFRSGGWLMETDALTPREKSGWASVRRSCETFARYAGSDVLDLAAALRVLPRPDGYVLDQRERPFQAMCARVSHEGFRLDHPHIQRKIAEFTQAREAARQRVSELCPAITNPSSTKEVPAALAELGVPLGRTAGGNLSAAKGELERLAKAPGYEHAELLQQILEYRHDVTTLGLLLEPLYVLCERGDGRMRPVVYTINADTGRTSCVRPNGQQFCYSSQVEILTEHGFVPFPEIDGSQKVAQWRAGGAVEFVTPLNVIHEAYSGPMVKISGEHHEQVVTPNHRVYSLSRRGHVIVEEAAAWLGLDGKIIDRKLARGGFHRTGRRLSPEELLSLRRAVAVQADGHLREDCTFIGLGFTKQRKADRARELGLDVRLTSSVRGGKRVWQAKAYEHQVARWLSLPDKNFRLEELTALDAADLREFIAEIMLWDGDSSRGREYSQAPDRSASVEAVEIAAILAGYSTTRRKKSWNGIDYDCVNLFPQPDRWASRTWGTEVPSDGMVHCVEVPSGAVVVRCNGKIVVSGNSRQGGIRACVIADPGKVGISADFAGVEIRVGAALSGDRALLEAELSTRCQACGCDPCDMAACGKDQKGLHWMAARLAFGPDATKEDRYNSKRLIFSKMFGGGPESGARQVGVSQQDAVAVHRAFEAIAPVFTAWDGEMRAWVKAGNRGYQAYSGRTIWLPPRHRPHAAGNYAIQGTARELLVDGVLRWGQTRWGHLPLLPIHDEVLTWVPEAEAAEASATLMACMRNERFEQIYGVPIEAAASEPFHAWPDSS